MTTALYSMEERTRLPADCACIQELFGVTHSNQNDCFQDSIFPSDIFPVAFVEQNKDCCLPGTLKNKQLGFH